VAVEKTMQKLAEVVDEINGRSINGKSVLHPSRREEYRPKYSGEASTLGRHTDPEFSRVAD